MKTLLSKLKAAFYVFYKSATSPKYYKDLLSVRVSFSIKYFAILAVIASLVAVGTNLKSIKKTTVTELLAAKEELVKLYPEALEITIKDGVLSTNSPVPIVIPAPECKDCDEEVKEESGEIEFENLLVIDENGTLNDLEAYGTVVLVNKTNLLVRDTGGKIETYPHKDYPNTVITRDFVERGAEKLDPIIRVMPYVFSVAVFVAALFYYFGIRLGYLLIVGLGLFAFGKIKKLDLKYSKYYQIGLHAMTLPLVVEIVASVTNIAINIPFWFILTNLVIGIIAILNFNKK